MFPYRRLVRRPRPATDPTRRIDSRAPARARRGPEPMPRMRWYA